MTDTISIEENNSKQSTSKTEINEVNYLFTYSMEKTEEETMMMNNNKNILKKETNNNNNKSFHNPEQINRMNNSQLSNHSQRSQRSEHSEHSQHSQHSQNSKSSTTQPTTTINKEKKFYLNTDSIKSKQRFEQMKKLRQEYSHEKTSQVVKEVEEKIKGWMNRQKSSEKKRLLFIEKSIKQKEEIEKREKEERMSSKEKLKQQHHEEVMERLKKLKEKSAQRFENLRNSKLSNPNPNSVPLYLQKQIEFDEKKKYEELEIKEKLMKKRSSTYVNIKKHENKLEELDEIKEKNGNNRFNKYLKKKAITTDQLSKSVSNESFVTMFNNNNVDKEEAEIKRQRMLEFSENVKYLYHDEETLTRIKEKNKDKVLVGVVVDKNDNDDNDEENEKNSTIKKKSQSYKNFSTKIQESQTEIISRETKKHRDSSSSYLKQSNIKSRVNSEKKLKTTPTPKEEMNRSKVSTGASRVSTKLPKLPEISNKEKYRNYLPDVKVHLLHTDNLDEIEKTKRQFKKPGEAAEEFKKRSEMCEKNVYKMIRELNWMETKDTYEKSLLKEAEIDEMYQRTLKMKLACLEI